MQLEAHGDVLRQVKPYDTLRFLGAEWRTFPTVTPLTSGSSPPRAPSHFLSAREAVTEDALTQPTRGLPTPRPRLPSSGTRSRAGGRGTYPGSGVHEGPVPQQAAHHLRLPRPGGHVQRRLPALRAQRGRRISDRAHSAASQATRLPRGVPARRQ